MNPLIVIDARWLNSGIGTYIENLLAGIHRRGQREDFRICAVARRRDLKKLGSISDVVSVVNSSIYTIWEQIEVLRAARDCDLLHVPHYNAPVLYGGKLLVTIHDLTHIIDPVFRKTASSWVYAKPMLNRVARKASRIITVSEYSKCQIVEHLGVSPSKV